MSVRPVMTVTPRAHVAHTQTGVWLKGNRARTYYPPVGWKFSNLKIKIER
jgi:hypothetical protein